MARHHRHTCFAFVGVPSFDRLGVFRVVIGSLVTLILSNTALLVCGDSFTAILLIRLVQGLCSAGLMVTLTPAIARWFPRDEIGRAMGLPSLGAGVGMVIGLTLYRCLWVTSAVGNAAGRRSRS
jgi:MFS family permease